MPNHIHMRQILRASFVSLVLLACENGSDDDSTSATTTGTASSDGTSSGTTSGTDATTDVTGGPTTEPTTTTPPTTSTGTDTGTDDTGTDDTGPVNTATDDTGTDDTGPVNTATDDTGTDDTGPVDTGTDDTGPSGLSFAIDVYAPIIMPSCSCHADGSGGMKLGNDAASAFAAIVGVPSNDVPGMSRVEPGDSDNSYLFHKVEGTQLDVGGEGNQMPVGGLNPAQIDTIKQWIDGGAQP